MNRERIEEIREYGLMVSCAPDSRGDIMPEELEELCRLALRATDPDIVMVPREPTQRMMGAAMVVKGKYVSPGRLYAVYTAMLAAAQEMEEQE